MPDFALEQALHSQGMGWIAGVDEVGRGPLAGPVAAAAVILDPACLPDGLDDSKRLTAQKRERLYDVILAQALAVSVSLVPATLIDQINIRQATHLAMRCALQRLSLPPAHALIDGNDVPRDLVCPAQSLIKGDARSLSIAAASIVAKVTRDRLMARVAKLYPGWGFETHMGYGTAQHLAMLNLHGPTSYHRRCFAPVAAADNPPANGRKASSG